MAQVIKKTFNEQVHNMESLKSLEVGVTGEGEEKVEEVRVEFNIGGKEVVVVMNVEEGGLSVGLWEDNKMAEVNYEDGKATSQLY